MLNCTSACIRNLGAGARLRTTTTTRLRGSGYAVVQRLATPSRTAAQQQFRNSSSLFGSFRSFEKNEAFAPYDDREGTTRAPRIRTGRNSAPRRSAERSGGDGEEKQEDGKTFDTSDRKVRLVESFRYTRHQAKESRRTKGNKNVGFGAVAGNIKEVKMLETLAKTREMPDSVSPTVVNKELKWLQDPKEMSVRIARLLQADQVALAVAMVRKAEALKMECGVAWNRLLAYCFQKYAPEAAFSFYNDVSLIPY